MDFGLPKPQKMNQKSITKSIKSNCIRVPLNDTIGTPSNDTIGIPSNDTTRVALINTISAIVAQRERL